MTLHDIYTQFDNCKFWEERYRLLIQLSRKLPRPTEEQLTVWAEIPGCESRLWFELTTQPRQIHAYSEARLMQGLLFILITALHEADNDGWRQFDVQKLFDELQIARNLTATKLNGLMKIQEIVRQAR
ncbi:SufE family protein [Glaesserella sp.]|uniref:SufE family protein n=1 Tax=Glaesserella sp. TaxID=2094731 RepID=UPI0035A0670A